MSVQKKYKCLHADNEGIHIIFRHPNINFTIPGTTVYNPIFWMFISKFFGSTALLRTRVR